MQKASDFCVDDAGWIHCPECKCRTRTKIRPDTVLKNFPVYCPQCRKEYLVDVQHLKIELSVEPESR